MARRLLGAAILLMLGCDGGATAAESVDIDGDWIFRLDGRGRNGACYYSAVMRLERRGRKVAGKMYYPNSSCPVAVDTATAVTGELHGDSITFTVSASGLVAAAQVRGDSMFGVVNGPAAGAVSAHRVSGELHLDRPRVHISGAINQSFVGYPLVHGWYFRILAADGTTGIILDSNYTAPTLPWFLRVGSYPVGEFGDPVPVRAAAFTPGRSVRIRSGNADVLEVTPTYIHIRFDVEGTTDFTGERIRFQSDFRIHAPSYLSQLGASG